MTRKDSMGNDAGGGSAARRFVRHERSGLTTEH